MSKKSDMPLEKAIEKLERIVEQLESGDVPLEKSIDMYEEGRRLGAQCLDRLAGLEQRVQKVLEDAEGNLVTEPFDDAKEDHSP